MLLKWVRISVLLVVELSVMSLDHPLVASNSPRNLGRGGGLVVSVLSSTPTILVQILLTTKIISE